MGCSAGEQRLPEDTAESGPGREAAVMPLQLSDWDPDLKSPISAVAFPEQETNLLTALLLRARFLLGLHPELRLRGSGFIALRL